LKTFILLGSLNNMIKLKKTLNNIMN
jgi:hypothetical protein